MDAASFLAAYKDAQSGFAVPASLSGRFQLVSCLKHAPQSQVYLLTGADGAPYILRVTPAASYDRLLREHLTLRRLHDPAFPHPVACFREGDRAYLIREYVPGTPLSELVENGDPMSPARAAKFAREICAVLEKLHALDPPVIHRDIKPHNFIMTPEGKLRLVDLDAAAEYRPESWLDTVVMGTAATAAPEQFGFKRCDMRTDVYGVGMLMVFLMTGDYDPRAFFKAPLSRAPRRIVKKCLRFDPEMRYPTMARLSRALARWQKGWRALPVAVSLALVLAMCAYGLHAWRGQIWHAVAEYTVAASREEYVFFSPLVEKAVRLQLDRPTGRVSMEDLQKITKIFICGNDVYKDADELWTEGDELHLDNVLYEGSGTVGDLSDLKNMPNLKEIGLSRLGLSDLSPLVGLHPTALYLAGNGIENLIEISKIGSLETLDLSDNPMSGLLCIESLTNLKTLDIGATNVQEFSPLLEINLESLDAFDMLQSPDLSALPAMTTLKTFCSNNLTPDQWAPLTGMTWLEGLTLNDCGVTDISFLNDFKQLVWLNFHNNPISSLEPLRDNQTLVYIGMDNIGLPDLSVFATMPNLVQLGIRWNSNADLSALDDMPKLELLFISTDMLPNLPHPVEECPFTVDWCD